MLVIRLMRTGKKGERKFRVVVKEKRDRRDGIATEILGWYEKTSAGEKKQLEKDRIAYWISQGAKTTPIIDRILKA